MAHDSEDEYTLGLEEWNKSGVKVRRVAIRQDAFHRLPTRFVARHSPSCRRVVEYSDLSSSASQSSSS